MPRRNTSNNGNSNGSTATIAEAKELQPLTPEQLDKVIEATKDAAIAEVAEVVEVAEETVKAETKEEVAEATETPTATETETKKETKDEAKTLSEATRQAVAPTKDGVNSVVDYKPVSVPSKKGRFETTLLFVGNDSGVGVVFFSEKGEWKKIGNLNETGIRLTPKQASNALLVKLAQLADKNFNIIKRKAEQERKLSEDIKIRETLDNAQACESVEDPFAGLF